MTIENPAAREAWQFRTVRRACLLLALGVAWLLLAGGVAIAHRHHGMEMAPGERPADMAERSIYLLESTWRDDTGAPEQLVALRGHPVVLAMVYTSCENACPVLVEDMKRIRRTLPAGERDQVTFALFSFDPARDTPAALAAYRGKRGLEDSHWRLFTADDDAVLELAAVLGMRLAPDGYGGFSHSSLITVLDAEGVVQHQQVGVHQDPAGSVAALRTLLGG